MNCKSYIPGYYTTRGLHKDRGNSWPIYYDNNLLNGHLHNSFIFSTLNGYSEYDKEMLKRTMLEHEAIFRKQVYELHRLYRIQKDLMEEFQKHSLYRFSSWAVKSKSSLSSSEAQSQVTGRIWQMHDHPALSSSQSRETTTVTNTNVSPISTPWSCFGPLENGALGRDDESNASFRASTKRMFDLQLPSDVYTDAEGTDRSEKEEITGFSSVTTAPFLRKCNGDPENEVKLTLANVSSSNGGARKYNPHGKNSLFHCLADLNEPIDDTSLVGTSYSFPSRHVGFETRLDENHRPNGSLRSANGWLQISCSNNQDFDEIGSFPEVNKESSQVCSQFLGEVGQSKFDPSLDSDKGKCSRSFESIQMSLVKHNDIFFKDLNKPETLFVQKKGSSLEIPRESSDFALSDTPEKLASLNINAPTSPLLSTWMKPSGGEKQSSAQLQTMACFEKSTTMNNFRIFDTTADHLSVYCDGLQLCHPENRKSSHQNGFNHGCHPESRSVLQFGVSCSNLNLNMRENCSFDIRDGVAIPKNKATSEVVGDCEVLSPELPWHENKPNFNGSSAKLDLCFGTLGLGNEGEVEVETPIPSCKIEDFSSNLHCSEKKTQRNEAPDCSGREKTIVLPILDKIEPNVNFSIGRHHQQVDELQHGSVFRDITPLDYEKELSAENRSCRNHIDLNREVTFIDEPNLLKNSAKIQIFLPLETSDTFSSFKAAPLIDMDAPVMPLEENNTPETQSTPRTIRNDDMLVEEAAENMISLLIDKLEHSDDDRSCSATEPPCNTLHWFADVALLSTHKNKSDVEMDHFELRTLQLEEMKPENAWCGPLQTQNAKDDEKNMAALLLFKKPRRGQARKRRQRRDFQKDTLPGLATLSRKEIVEDFQLIGGLMKASGCHWENGMPAKAKRRQLSGKTSIAGAKEHSIPQKTLFLFSKNGDNPEFVVDRPPGMVGWGRTTRRCRRSRCQPPQSVTAALT